MQKVFFASVVFCYASHVFGVNCVATGSTAGSVTMPTGGWNTNLSGSSGYDYITCTGENTYNSGLGVDLGTGGATFIADGVTHSLPNTPGILGIDGNFYFFGSGKIGSKDTITLTNGTTSGNIYGERFFLGSNNRGGGGQYYYKKRIISQFCFW